MEKIFDLPAHPLFVHFPIVLAPLLALGAVLIAVRPEWRRRYGLVVLGGAVITFVMVILARQSGEELFQLLKREPSIERHQDLADQTTLLFFGFLVLLAGYVGAGHLLDRRDRAAIAAVGDGGGAAAAGASSGARSLLVALAVLTVVLGGLSTVWMARTGHAGAKSHWSFVNE